jgi:thiol:disulfide interchange protein DsbD
MQNLFRRFARRIAHAAHPAVLTLISFIGLLTTGPSLAAEPLPPEQAFTFSARALDAQTLEARWQIAEGYYLYRDKFSFHLTAAAANAPAQATAADTPITAQLPAGKMKMDDLFGEVEVYRQTVTARLPLPTQASGGTPATVTLKTVAQGCWDGGICYPPQTYTTSIDLPATAAAMTNPADAAPATQAPATSLGVNTAPGDENSRIANLFKNSRWPLVVLSFFGFGLLLSLTPCVLPMIPILSGIIVNHGHAVSHRRAFMLSLAYVLGMAITYAAAGVAAGFSGTLLTSALQNSWVLGGFALIFVALAFSMFGVYELQLPTALQSKLADQANHQGGSVSAIALMGALSALIVGPCVAAPLAGALLYIAKTGDALLGGAALFALALGMGVPLLLVGTFSRRLLPKTGPWMENVKKFFGVLMLATALWLASPVLPGWLVMLGWALLLIFPAIFLSALDSLPVNAHGLQRLGKGLGLVLFITGLAILLGLLGGNRDPLQPLGFLRGNAAAPDGSATAGNAAVPAAPTFIKIASVAELDAQLKTANKPVMLDFWAEWCISCKEMERFTFAHPDVAARMQDFLLLKADVTANNAADRALLSRFNLFGPPGIIFFNANGQENTTQRVIGFQNASQFLQQLNQAALSRDTAHFSLR